MFVIEEMRKINAALPVVDRVVLMTGHIFVAEDQTEPLPSEKTLIAVWVDKQQYTFIAKDHEWQQGTVANDVITYMKQLLGPQEGNVVD